MGQAMGCAPYVCRRVLLLMCCILGVFQYGMVLTNGVSFEDFNSYYGITTKQGDNLYAWLNFGACALSCIPGLLYDRFGCVATMACGTMLFDAAILFQLAWTGQDFPGNLTTMQGLQVCYLGFGFASTFFNVIGSFAPLVAFPEEHVGKVSACIQVCMSLGITLQAEAYYAAKSGGGEYIVSYLKYSVAFTTLSGVLMCAVFQASAKILKPDNSQQQVSRLVPQRSLRGTLLTLEFMFFSLLFLIAIGFSFSFLDCESRIAQEAGADVKSMTATFGVLNALGRLSVSVPLDYTRHHPLGGVYTYIVAALAFFISGVLFLALPSSANASQVYMANVLVSFGYGGLLGIVPPALRLEFGTANLGFIYGLLYVGVSISEPIWGLLFVKPTNCVGVGCYRTYCWACVSGLALTLFLAIAMFQRDRKSKLKGGLQESLQSSVTGSSVTDGCSDA